MFANATFALSIALIEMSLGVIYSLAVSVNKPIILKKFFNGIEPI